jgi:prepilin-type N-terminal cleavage/methylation domain-containing protein/prepilin-type processing-associated H-X9-DG protein
MKTGRASAGFTLIELLTVIAVVAVLVIMASQSVLTKRDGTAALNNLRQIGMGFALYAAENDGLLPGRNTSNKWPRLIGNYLKDLRVYAYPGDSKNYLIADDPQGKDPLSDLVNNTSFIYNGFDDLGAFDDPAIPIRPVNFDSTGEMILLGVPRSGDNNFYMDFVEGNHRSILNIDAFGGGSHYLFADGSARHITKEDYNREVGGKRWGDTLWLADKEWPIP